MTMKLPAFWPDTTEVWFTQADTQLTILNISVSKAKFYHAVTVLPQKIASQILDLIRAPPAGDPYDYQHFEALVSLSLCGDQKPSHLMKRMLALLRDDYKPDFILRGLFLQGLPNDV